MSLPTSLTFKGHEWFLNFQESVLENLQHLLSPLSSMEASHRIHANQALSKLKFSLLKFKIIVLILTFSVFSRIPNCNIVTSAAQAISSRNITKQYCIQFVDLLKTLMSQYLKDENETDHR